MSDLGTRLAEGLTGVAGRSPHPGDLGAGARERMRRRRRTTATVVAAALAVVAVPVGLTVVGAGDDPGADRRETTVSDPVPGDWRVETWHDLTLRVPPEWTWGSGTDWCTTDASAESATPVVSRPGRVARAIFCAPTYAYGVHFFEPSGGELPPGTEGAVQQYRGRRYPYGAWIGYASTGQAAVWVVTDSRTLTRQVLDSTEVVGEVDPNGCATRIELTTYSSSARVAVCRYAADGWLEQSEVLSKEDSEAVRRAVGVSPRLEDDVPTGCGDVTTRGPAILFNGGDVWAKVSWHGRCRGVDDGADDMGYRQLTEEVMYWALSPGWSGAVDNGVPMPEELRTE
jgi:hypothetical protein